MEREGKMLIGTLIGAFVVICFLCFLWVRNNQVYDYRNELVNQISIAAKQDLSKDWEWRYDVLDSIGYSHMVLKFWKPLNSFYLDTSFIKYNPNEGE